MPMDVNVKAYQSDNQMVMTEQSPECKKVQSKKKKKNRKKKEKKLTTPPCAAASFDSPCGFLSFCVQGLGLGLGL